MAKIKIVIKDFHLTPEICEGCLLIERALEKENLISPSPKKKVKLTLEWNG